MLGSAVVMALALILVAQASAAPPASSSDVVVNGLRKLRLSTELDNGKVKSCTVRVSSGDAGIDRTACAATTDCVAQGVDQSEPLADCIELRLVAYVRGRASADGEGER